jgi:hypothetical protein
MLSPASDIKGKLTSVPFVSILGAGSTRVLTSRVKSLVIHCRSRIVDHHSCEVRLVPCDLRSNGNWRWHQRRGRSMTLAPVPG